METRSEIVVQVGRIARRNGDPRFAPYLSAEWCAAWLEGYDEVDQAMRPAKYRQSAEVEVIALSPKAPWVMGGAVGSSEPAPNPWKGISGPAGPLEQQYRLMWDAEKTRADESAQRISVLEADNAALSGRVGELESYSHELAKGIDARNGQDQETEAYQYLKRLFLHLTPQCCVLPDLLGVCTQIDNAIAGLKMDNADLRKRLWLPVEQGDHPYNGPLSKPDENGKRVPAPDPVHERFHGAIGDVLSGKVMQSARRQMQEALKSVPKEPTTIPTGASKDDPRRIGWHTWENADPNAK